MTPELTTIVTGAQGTTCQPPCTSRPSSPVLVAPGSTAEVADGGVATTINKQPGGVTSLMRTGIVGGCVVEGAAREIERITGYRLTSHSLVFSGVCPECALTAPA